MAIYILTHRSIENWDTKFYIPLHLSNHENPEVPLKIKDFYPDLADMNQLYNELSGAYYIWKHDTDNIKGMVQYSTYPDMTEDEITEVLNTKEFIVNSSWVGNVCGQFKYVHDNNGELWNIMVDLSKKSGIPDDVIKIWENFNTLFHRNIIIAKRDDFDEYMSWLFPILTGIREHFGWHSMDDVREFVSKRNYIAAHPYTENQTDYRVRFIGFISERLQTLYLLNKFGADDVYKHIHIPKFINNPVRLQLG